MRASRAVCLLAHKDPREWLRDPKLFDEVLTAIVHALMWLKPSGDRDEQFFFYHSTACACAARCASRHHRSSDGQI